MEFSPRGIWLSNPADCLERLATARGEAESPKTSQCSTQSKVWEPELNGGQATVPAMRSVIRGPPSFSAGSVETLQSNLRITFMPVVQELTEIRNPIDVWESSTSKEGRSQRSSSWVEDLIEEDRVQNAATLKCKLSSSSTYTGKASRITHYNASHSSRPFAAKKGEDTAASKDVSTFESLSDNDDLYEEGVEIVSEKRRKRMLSNRASAQRSRQRRQERLDTLEVLVAELRVENAALTRKANLAALAAKKSEKENKTLRGMLGRKDSFPLSETSNESDKTTENSDMAVDNEKHGGAGRMYGGASIEPTRNHGASSADTGETRQDDIHSRERSRPWTITRDDGRAGAANSKTWNNNITSSSFDFEFNPDDSMESEAAAEAYCGGGGTLNGAVGVLEGINVKDLCQSAMMNLAQPHSFQNLDSFGIELHCGQEMDKKNFDPRSAEDIWLDSLANCLK